MPECPACAELLEGLNYLRVVLPRQILQELRANLSEDEMRSLFRVLSRLPRFPKIDWNKASLETVAKYRRMGCKLGDAVVSAHLEDLDEIPGLPFRRLRADRALVELKASEPH